MFGAVWHEDGARDLILRAKWQGDRAALLVLADLIGESCGPAACAAAGLAFVPDGWCAVPRDPWRWLRRGTPLSERLGVEIGRRTGLPRLPPPRRKWRPPQTSRTGAARRSNLAGAFAYPRRSQRKVRGKRVVIIDDVATTGSTLEQCARALTEAGAASVAAWVVALVRHR
ncbi:MAG: ComF family protein [Planctomycetota bacterium]